MLEGELVLVEDASETMMRPGDAAGFKAGGEGESGGAAAAPAAEIRKNFAETAFSSFFFAAIV